MREWLFLCMKGPGIESKTVCTVLALIIRTAIIFTTVRTESKMRRKLDVRHK